MDCIAGFFAKATGRPARHFTPSIQRQIFENKALASPLFRLFLTNCVNRAHGAPMQAEDWAELADFFMDWDAVRFAQRYPLKDGCPCDGLRAAFAETASSRNLIRGNVDYHLEALRQLGGARNGWVRLLQTAQQGSHLLAGRPGSNRVLDNHVLDDGIAMRALWSFDLAAIPLDCLTVDDLWRATDRLIAVPGIGRQLALNFIKDAGYGHAFKPDTHTRKIAGMAFRADSQEYRATNAGERACVDAALAYAQALSAHGSWNGWTMTLAAVDRLMGLAGSGKLWIMGEDAPRLKKRGAAGRRRAVAKILRGALRLGRFDA
jgi:hypothetical protein